MIKRDLFIKAMQAKCYERLAWSLSAFCLTRENEDEYKKDPYPYRLVTNPVGHFYCDPDNNNELSKIDDGVANQPLYQVKERLDITPSDIPNLGENLNTSYGNLLTNWIVLINAFGNKVPYQEGKFNIGKVEDLIIGRLEPTPADVSKKTDQFIYIDEYIKFCDSVFFLTGLSQVCVWTVTEKMLLPPPGIKELKEKLFAENEGHLNEMATIAKINDQLMAFDKEYLKDDPGYNFMNGKKSLSNRQKSFLMQGGELGLSGSVVNATLIKNSLSEGWDINAFPVMNDSLRIGVYGRGQQTALGGVAVKWLLRASSNLNVTVEDCGSRIGRTLTVNDSNVKDLVGFNVIMKEGSKTVNDISEAGAYMGKKIMLRSPMYCKLELTDYCQVCVGKRLALNKNGLSSAIGGYGSALLSLFLSAAHSKSLSLAKMNYLTSIT